MRRGFRGFRRAMRQAGRPGVPPMLRRAHQMMSNGNYTGAAEAFEQLGHAAEGRGFPQAANMFLQAGRARILAGQNQAGLNQLMHGLTMLATAGNFGRLSLVGNRVVTELNQLGLTNEADQIANWLKTTLPAKPEMASVQTFNAPSRKPVLPTHCPGCGGPVRADEVEWLDEVTAECMWCGSPVRAES